MLQIALALTLALTTVSGETTVVTLFDFETDADLAAWHNEGGTSVGPGWSLERVASFATSGECSLCFRTPKWRSGLAQWPAFEAKPAITDWSGYDRLVFDVTNASVSGQTLRLLISDAKTPTRSGVLHEAHLPPQCYQQQVIPLAQLATRNIDPKAIGVMHFVTECPPDDLTVYIDHVVLLRPGEPAPVPRPGYVKEMAGLLLRQVASIREARRESQARVTRLAAGAPAVAAWATRLVGEDDRKIAAFEAQLERQYPSLLQSQATIARLRDDGLRLESVVRLRAGFESVRKSVEVGRGDRTDVVVGFATSMEKVLPRAAVPDLRVSREVSVSLACNEKEAFQVIVMPCERKASQVSVRVTGLKTSRGEHLVASGITASPVGYVETKDVPPSGSSHVGWWPDPILEFMSAADVESGDAQAFWVRVRTSTDQPSGLYRGKLEVLVGGAVLYAFDLSVHVYPFALPDRAPLNSAITFWPAFCEPDGAGGWREGPYRDASWRKHKLEWADFLADYYITYDSLYSTNGWVPDFDVIQHLHKQGRLGMFNLGYYFMMGDKPAEQAEWKTDVARRIGEPYGKAKELGLLDHAYIYGCDENPAELFPGVQRAAEYLKKQFPGVLVMTTTYDHTFGTDSVIKAMDAFAPLTPRYRGDVAAKARAEGKQVWWYICCEPLHPYANMFVESPASEGRVLMGAQTARYRPDGFLYYHISYWDGNKAITSGPFTDWDPRSWRTYHGDGSWTCLGPDGTPLPTIRLENFRDGVEDYAYVLILEEAIRRMEARKPLSAKQQAWLAGAKDAAQVPLAVVSSMTEYTKDPTAIYAWRNRMGEMIEESRIAERNRE